MRATKAALAATAVLAAVTGSARAQDNWPNRPITLVVPFSAGGGVDASARLQALAMGEILGQTIVVENVGAAAGTVGSGRVAKAAPDGYTMLIGNSGTQVYSQSRWADANLFFDPTPALRFGLEYAWFQQSYVDGTTAINHRAWLSALFLF